MRLSSSSDGKSGGGVLGLCSEYDTAPAAPAPGFDEPPPPPAAYTRGKAGSNTPSSWRPG